MQFTLQPRRAQTELAPGPPTEILDILHSATGYAPGPHRIPPIPGYEIDKLIDHGGMSNIYLARQEGLNRQVAIKMIRPEDFLDDQIRERFLREASSIAALQHPNVVQIYEIGEAEGMPYLCLEYVPGGNLERKIRTQNLSAHQSAEIVRQLAEGIQAAHDHQIIHRDLKPANILWVEAEPPDDSALDAPPTQTIPAPQVTVKITDFGLARILYDRSDQTKSGYAIGTPSFMSPEQASGQPSAVGKATDIYGLGAILYELLTGQPPFVSPTSLETIRMVRFDPPVPPSQLNRSVPRDLESICLQCLEKQPENRYATARAVAADLQRFLQGRPVAAHHAGRLRQWLRHLWRQPLRTLAQLGIVGLVVGAVIGVLLLNRASDHLIQKERELDQTRNDVVEPPTVPTATLPPQVGIVLQRLRQEPARPDNARETANLGDDWLLRLPRDHPDDFAVQFGVGDAYRFLKSPERAIPRFEQARQLAERHMRDGEGGVEAWANLAAAHERLGDMRLLQNDRQAAARDYERTIAIRETLTQDDPRDKRWALGLASVCRKQAEVQAAEKEWFTAVLLYDRRLGLLVKHFADDPSFASAIRATHERMAELHDQLGNKEAAEYHRRAAREIAG